MASVGECNTASLASPAADLVTAVAFSPLATHLALASLDHSVRILHPSPHSPPSWDHAPADWKAHDGPVLALAWAPPQFGTLLATGGVDGAVNLWLEEAPPPRAHSHSHTSTAPPPPPRRLPSSSSSSFNGAAHPHQQQQRWSLCSSLTDSRGTLRSLSFAPADFGLKLAAVASDAHLRVWECLDPLALKDWVLREDVDLAALPPLAPSSGASLGAAVAAGGGSGVHLSSSSSGGAGAGGSSGLGSGDGFGLSSAGASSPSSSSTAAAAGPSSTGSGTAAPFPSVSSASSATGSSSHGGGGVGASGGGGGGGRAGGTVESDGGWAVSWCEEAWWGERLAVSSGSNGVVRLFHFPSSDNPSSSSTGASATWTNFLNLIPSRPFQSYPSQRPSSAPSDSHDDSPSLSSPSHQHHTYTTPTSSLAWAPPSGRSYLLLASGARDGRARVWKVFPPALALPDDARSNPSATAAAVGEEGGAGEWSARLEVELEPLAAAGARGEERASVGRGAGMGVGGAMCAARVGWNVTGTVLSTSGGEDGRVRLWKPTYTGQWRQLAVLSAEDAPGVAGGEQR
ncbi:hypothetical protein Rhopal_001182-T1 [Rhodotorula paludigena]|uniref:WD40 repeat-like protein n=1 Tax=Rhodotorula paludigena TaxID=86838 RepID=A0AAV5GFU9_9BASI|nr:hypothetical protein Rhopal_001182-T1 [Rhodotorula paludigena]